MFKFSINYGSNGLTLNFKWDSAEEVVHVGLTLFLASMAIILIWKYNSFPCNYHPFQTRVLEELSINFENSVDNFFHVKFSLNLSHDCVYIYFYCSIENILLIYLIPWFVNRRGNQCWGVETCCAPFFAFLYFVQFNINIHLRPFFDLSMYVLFCLPLFLLPSTIPCRLVLMMTAYLELWPNHFSLRRVIVCSNGSY